MKVTIEPIKLSTLPEMFGGTADFLGIKQDSEAVCICTDSREACEGAIFVAIKGENTDGHKYINKAVQLGASAVVCDHIPEDAPDGCLYIVTENTKKALDFFRNDTAQYHIEAVDFGDLADHKKIHSANYLFTDTLEHAIALADEFNEKL